MILASLLASASEEELARLASEHVKTDEPLSRAQLCNFLESSILSFRFVQDFVINRQPPTFALLSVLLDAPGFQLPADGLKERAMSEARRIGALIDGKELLYRDDQLYVYRRALHEARRNDLDVNSSESALLATLRQSMEIALVEHYLIEHHSDLREFWDRPDCFEHEQTALRTAGVIFERNGHVLIPEDLVPAISQSLGVEMPTESLRRLLGFLTNADLANALNTVGSLTSGTRDTKIERVITERIQPRTILQNVDNNTLRSICRDTGATVKGRKEEVIERIIEHFAQGRDQIQEEPAEPERSEDRQLSKANFDTLFGFLQHQELSDILRRFPDLRQTGTKETRIDTLWDAHLSEQTYLAELMNRDLENILYRLGLRLGGSKQERIDRIVQNFLPAKSENLTDQVATIEPIRMDHSGTQEAFRQKASNPTSALQPWLNDLLEANGLVRCYSTEDPNPSKQLKNKLSQAASANNGVLVLLLNDKDAYDKTLEALVERWMTNEEWSKGVSCVALGFPIGAYLIQSVISNRPSPWPDLLKRQINPEMQILDAKGATMTIDACGECGAALTQTANFCANCGARRGG